MGKRSAYAPGAFCWVDLATPDPAAARTFYGALFEWEAEDLPIGPGRTYTLMRRDGHDVAGVVALPPDAAGLPAWNAYVSVEDADATCARAAALGGSVVTPPFDTVVSARVAAIRDPQGAVVGLWEPGDSVGATLVNDPGAFCLTQLNTTDPEGAAAFHTALFGWGIAQVAEDPAPYWGITVGGSLNAGMMVVPAPGVPPHWLVYVTSGEDLHEAVGTVEALGGDVALPVTEVPGGRIIVARDPQGAVFGMFEGRTDP